MVCFGAVPGSLLSRGACRRMFPFVAACVQILAPSSVSVFWLSGTLGSWGHQDFRTVVRVPRRAKGIRKILFLLPLALARAAEVMVCPEHLAAYSANAMPHTNVPHNVPCKWHIQMSYTHVTYQCHMECLLQMSRTSVAYKCHA